ncbi:MAG: hypothetical protein ACK4SF_05015 [Algoriphagus aquaeductus]|uniref:hypothetical protein n=1 Tax=Algoriphagus aquaeductus TaxID=475299 RepID=UPI00391C3413
MYYLSLKILISLYLGSFIDPQMLLGFWKLTSSEANYNLINSPAFEATPKKQQDEIIEINELYLNNAYFEFKLDTVFWIDVNPREKKLVNKKGKWSLNNDTLVVFDYDRIFSYKYLVKVSDNELELRFIFPNGDLARSKTVFRRQ